MSRFAHVGIKQGNLAATDHVDGGADLVADDPVESRKVLSIHLHGEAVDNGRGLGAKDEHSFKQVCPKQLGASDLDMRRQGRKERVFVDAALSRPKVFIEFQDFDFDGLGQAVRDEVFLDAVDLVSVFVDFMVLTLE